LAKARQTLCESTPKQIYDNSADEAESSGIPILPGTHPFLYCRIRRHGRHYNGSYWSSELGTLYNTTNTAEKLFKNFTGGNDSHYDGYVIPPTTQFVGPNARWLHADGWVEYAGSGSQRDYPCYEMILMFFKNTTEKPMTQPVYRYLSSNDRNSNYNKSSAYVGTPNETDDNRNIISSINWACVHNYSSSTAGTTANFNITIPAKKTVALLFYSTAYYWTSSNGYIFCSTIGIYDFNKSLAEGLVVDHERTLKARQIRTKNIYEIWR